MRKMSAVLAVLAVTLKVSAADTNAPAPLKISAADAANYYDQDVVVTGTVAQVTIRPTVTFLNLDKPYPESPFTIVIFHGHSQFYGDADALRKKSIEIRGEVKKYHDKPEIVLDRTNQLTVFGLTNWPAPIQPPPVPPATKTNAPPAAPETNLPEIM